MSVSFHLFRTMSAHYLNDDQSIGEGRNSQHVQQGSFRHAHLVAGLDQVHVLNDLNRALSDLRRDV